MTVSGGPGGGLGAEPPALQRQEAGEQVEEEPGVNPILAQIEMLLAEEGVRAKATGGVESPSAQFESVLATSKGGGAALSGPVRGDMEAASGRLRRGACAYRSAGGRVES